MLKYCKDIKINIFSYFCFVVLENSCIFVLEIK